MSLFQSRQKGLILILMLGMMSAVGPFSIDMYLPGFPDIARDLNGTVAEVTLSLSSFYIGLAAGQLLYGPLLDRYGRKKPLYFGFILYIVASLCCGLVGRVDQLVALRLLQALGGCAGMVASRALVRDLFAVEHNARVFSLLMLVIGVSPIIAPTLGGFLAAGPGWRSIFFVLAAMGLAMLAAIHFAMPAGRPPDASLSLKPGPMLHAYRDVFRDRQFATYTFTGALSASGLYAYIAGSPTVFMNIFHVSEKTYGLIFGALASCLIIASQLNSVLLRRHSSRYIIVRALAVQSMTGLLLVAGTWTGLLGLYSTMGLICIFLSCQGFSFPNSSALSLAPFSRNAGTASALMGAIQMVIGTLASALVGLLANGTALPMTGIMALCASMSLAVLLGGRRSAEPAAL